MQIDVVKILYLFFRLSPLIIVSYFTLSSVFNQDLKGLIYLSGLLITCLVSTLISTYGLGDDDTLQPKAQCSVTYLGVSNTPISKNIPLGLVTLIYTLSYCFYIISQYKLWNVNISFLIIMILLILSDMIWQNYNGCAGLMNIGYASVIGLLGFMWALFIDAFKMTDLTMFIGISGKQVCDRPSRTKYRCRIVKK